MESVTEVFGRRLRSIRKSKGLTQEALGRAAKIDYKHVGGIERGIHPPSFAAVERIAKVLGVQYFELFLPDDLGAGHFEQRVKGLSSKLEGQVEARVLREFFSDLLGAVRRLETEVRK